MAERIQRQRTKGWRMPEGAVYVGRPSKWGNPFTVESTPPPWRDAGRVWFVLDENGVDYHPWHNTKRSAAEKAVELYEQFVVDQHWGLPDVSPDEIRTALAGRDLACWCPLDMPCHADTLLVVANPITSPGREVD